MKDKEKQNYTQVQARLLAKHLIESENRRKEKQIEEMAKVMRQTEKNICFETDCELCKYKEHFDDHLCEHMLISEELLKYYQPKLPEDSVVLSKEEYNDLKGLEKKFDDYLIKEIVATRKETAEKIYLQAKAIVDATKHIVQGREYLHIDALKEIVKSCGVEIKE